MHFGKNNFSFSVFIFLFIFTIYLISFAPAIYWGDSAEFSTTSHLLDIPHQPGYPLYNLLGKLFSLIPIGEVATRCNFFSSFFGALVSVLLYFILSEIFKILKYENNLLQIVGTILYSISYSFWNLSTFAEVYTILVFFVCSLILILLKSISDIRLFYFFVFLSGISITNHLLILPLGSGFLFFVLFQKNLRNKLFKKFPILAFLFILPVSLYLYLPIRSASEPYLDWGNPEKFFQFKNNVMLKPADIQEETYHPFLKKIWLKSKNIHILSTNLSRIIFILPILTGFLFIFRKEKLEKYLILSISSFLIISFIFSYFFIVRYIPFYQRVQGVHNFIFVELLLEEFPIYIIWCALLGIWFFSKKEKYLSLFFIFLFFLSDVFIIYRLFPHYRPYDHWRFFVIRDLILVIFITVGILNVEILFNKLKILPLIFFIFVLFLTFGNNYKIVDKKDYYYAEDFTTNILSSVSPPSLILIDGVDIYFLLYHWFNSRGISAQKIVFLDALTTRWYFEKLKREKLLPEKFSFSKNLKSGDVLKEIINLNKKKYKIYYTGTASFSEEEINKYCLKPRGVVYLVLPDQKNISCRYENSDILEHKKLIYKIYRYRGIEKKLKDRKATGVTNIYGTTHQILAKMYLQFNNSSLAIRELKRAIELFPQNSSNYELLAEIYYNSGDIEKAIKNLEKAINYDKNNIYLMNRLGYFYIDIRELRKAEEIFKKCLKIYPEFFPAHYNIGVVYQMTGKFEKAIEHFEIAKKISPYNPAPYLALGEIYYKNGDIKIAEEYFEEVLKREPENELAKKYLREIYYIRKNPNY